MNGHCYSPASKLQGDSNNLNIESLNRRKMKFFNLATLFEEAKSNKGFEFNNLRTEFSVYEVSYASLTNQNSNSQL